MAVGFSKTNKPLNPRGNDQSPKGYNRAELYTGKALDFDGTNDNISFPLFTFSTGNKYSLCIYANRDNNGMIWSRDNQWIEVKFTSGALQLRTYNNGLAAWSTYTLIDDVPANEWHQIIVTYDVDANLWKSYLNGQFIKSVTAAEPSNKHINRIGSSASTFYDGEFANAKIFEVELTAAQVADLYNNPEKIVPTGVADSALKLWLPMMEGAGTTAYDGSGNGNHGTISGATWTHGIGAPVAQTAVIDWNKQSYFAGNGGDDTYYTSSFADFNGQTAVTMYAEFVWQGITGNQNIIDWGGNNGLRVRIEGTNDYFQVLQKGGSNILTSTTAATENAFARIAVRTDANGLKLFLNGSEIASNSTALDSTASSTGFYIGRYAGSTAEYFNGIIPEAKVWTSSLTDAQLESLTAGTTNPEDYTSGAVAHWTGASEYEDQVGNYDLTAIGSPVRFLAPQGLTSGRDIFNALFNNVRKQGALNLDGNSWAEVHDNGSLDFGTGEFTLEAWAKVKYVNLGSSVNAILSLGGSGSGSNSAALFVTSSNAPTFYYYGNGSTASAKTEGDWVHIVGVYDETNATIYVNATQEDQDARTALSVTNALVKHIGRDSNATRYYQDQIAQPRIYNRALTAEEVLQNYNSGKSIYTNS